MVIPIISIALISCHKAGDIRVAIQPFRGMEAHLTDTICAAIQKTYRCRVDVLDDLGMPVNFYTQIKSPRYRADSILIFLKKTKPDSFDIVLGLTHFDISFTKTDERGRTKQPVSKYGDWGIFGLAHCPGESCVASSFRLNHINKRLWRERLKKVAIHEVGHTMGLRHCSNKNCVMTDVEEHIQNLDDAPSSLCNQCWQKLK